MSDSPAVEHVLATTDHVTHSDGTVTYALGERALAKSGQTCVVYDPNEVRETYPPRTAWAIRHTVALCVTVVALVSLALLVNAENVPGIVWFPLFANVIAVLVWLTDSVLGIGSERLHMPPRKVWDAVVKQGTTVPENVAAAMLFFHDKGDMAIVHTLFDAATDDSDSAATFMAKALATMESKVQVDLEATDRKREQHYGAMAAKLG